MKIKKLLLLSIILGSSMLVKSQQMTYEYNYDSAGNRTIRAVVQLNSKDCSNTAFSPLTDKTNNGVTMTLFPNPTRGIIRFETSSENNIGSYILSDVNGKLINNGVCKDRSLTIDLSARTNGIYLLHVIVEGEKRVYKIIKQ